MDLLRQFKIQARLWSILFVCLIVLLLIAFMSVSQLKDSMYRAKEEKNKNLVEIAHSVAQYFHEQQLNGQLTSEQAQGMAKEVLKKLRYAGSNYFWVSDYNVEMVMHPLKPELDGNDVSKFEDSVGNAIYKEFARIARDKGQGRYEYYFIKPGGTVPLPKFSHIKGFKPWQWAIGTGAYVDDVDEQYYDAVATNSIVVIVFIALMGGLLYMVIRSITQPIIAAKVAMADIATGSGNLKSELIVKGNDELTSLSSHFNEFVRKIRDAIVNVDVSASKLTQASSELLVTSDESNQSLEQQNEQIALVASAVNELTYSLQEVSESAEKIAGVVGNVNNGATRGVDELTSALNSMDNLSKDIDKAVDVITSLAAQTESIGNVLDVIRSIAEQTNLLALNAAIEAARAGEQGRGFAVVADEVRTLASRTQESTQEIDEMIAQLQGKGKQAVAVIQTSQTQSVETVSRASDARSALTEIADSVSNLSSIGEQNALAVAEQSKTVEEINQSVNSIHSIAEKTSSLSSRVAVSGKNVEEVSLEIESNLSHFSK